MEYSQILKDLRRESALVRNRIQSIIFDAKYVARFHDFPLVANERCGLWYIEPEKTAASVYFKSTDGHTGEWRFSLRRLNFHMLDMFRVSNTLVLVDSTRKGKLMPDALLKTVPMWCAVLNYIMYEDECGGAWEALSRENWLHTPGEMVSRSEHASMAKLVPQHAREVQKLGLISKRDIIQRLGAQKPIVPHWVYPGKLSQKVKSSSDYFSICCLTASFKNSSGTGVPGWHFPMAYVQGAADDHELWASQAICEGKLDHNLLWREIYYEPSEDLRVIDMATGDISPWMSEDEFLARIQRIYEKPKGHEPEESLFDFSPLRATGIILGSIKRSVAYHEIVGAIPSVGQVVVLSPNHDIIEIPKGCATRVDSYKVESSKKGSKKLRETLPDIVNGVNAVSPQHQVLILCDTGKDVSVAVALGILAKQFDVQWRPSKQPLHVNKDIIKQHLCLILECRQVNPSRNTLQAVNTFLMGR